MSSKQPTQPAKTVPTALEEDDEFEDFPVEDWPQEETEGAAVAAAAAQSGISTTAHANATSSTGKDGATTHLWEESWDDDDSNEDFSRQLKEELKKVEAGK